jgi:hypothetical protein
MSVAKSTFCFPDKSMSEPTTASAIRARLHQLGMFEEASAELEEIDAFCRYYSRHV